MALKCVFHVSTPVIRSAPVKTEPMRPRMPSLDLEVEWVDDPQPRGRSIETWMRARGWASED